MKRLKKISMALALLLLGFTTAYAGVSFSVGVGSGDYYQPVGDYDYLPYAYQGDPRYMAPNVNFGAMMSQYGVWVGVAPFGQVWKPYASNDWRPYTQGHWISTQQYGQMWEGYEPWAWAGYHYGNWIHSRNYGWVWIPGYEWHPGRVTWARSYDSIGWMPSPPNGYDYSRGYLSNAGSYNQFGYNDSDFGADFGVGGSNFGYGGPYYDPRYQNSYYNPSYNNMSFNLWVFVNNSNYGRDNYSGYTLGPEYTRHVFDRRLVRISNRPMERSVLERIVGRTIRDTPVEVRELRADNRAIRVIVPTGSENIDRIRTHSKVVVRDIIAPGFAEKQKAFKGQSSKNKEAVTRLFHQENAKPQVETLTSEQVINRGREASKNREQSRIQREQVEKEKLVKIEKEGKLKEPQKGKKPGTTDLKSGHPVSEVQAPKQNDAAKQKQQDAQRQSEVVKQRDLANQKQQEALKQSDVAKHKQQEDAKQRQQDAQKQSDVAKQKQQEAQKQSQQDAQKQSDVAKQKQQDTESADKKGKGDVDAEQAQTKDSEKIAEAKDPDKEESKDSKDKKAKAKQKKKDDQSPKPPSDDRFLE